MIRPADGVITLRYGATGAPYSASAPHQGLDIASGFGAPVVAPEAGTVSIASDLGMCGLAVEIKGTYRHRMCHNQKILVKVGQKVKEGQKVAEMGASGLATGPHVHWVVWAGSRRIDPEKLKVEETDMYKGKSAKYWYDKLQAMTKEKDKWRKLWSSRRAEALSFGGKIKAIANIVKGK